MYPRDASSTSWRMTAVAPARQESFGGGFKLGVVRMGDRVGVKCGHPRMGEIHKVG